MFSSNYYNYMFVAKAIDTEHCKAIFTQNPLDLGGV